MMVGDVMVRVKSERSCLTLGAHEGQVGGGGRCAPAAVVLQARKSEGLSDGVC